MFFCSNQARDVSTNTTTVVQTAPNTTASGEKLVSLVIMCSEMYVTSSFDLLLGTKHGNGPSANVTNSALSIPNFFYPQQELDS
jgi:hypothetical protein